jgi:hypothetical protein
MVVTKPNPIGAPQKAMAMFNVGWLALLIPIRVRSGHAAVHLWS